MKVIALYAKTHEPFILEVISYISQVFEELDVETQPIELNELPFFQNQEEEVAQEIANRIKESKGVIAYSHIHMGGMDGAMQTFFDHMTQYTEVIHKKPLMAVTYSSWLGETKAANDMLMNWEILGGAEGGKICLNKYTEFEDIRISIERSIEAFYRVIKQDRPEIISSERHLYLGQDIKTHPKVEPTIDLVSEPEIKHIDLSTEEQNIQEITALFKETLYGESEGAKRISKLPHYFIAQHDIELDLKVQFKIIDTEEEGWIWINQGDCHYYEGHCDQPTIEISLDGKVLDALISQELSYQKAFMLGKIKVRGNFIYLSRLDQVFKAI